jgi:hypothetical protein
MTLQLQYPERNMTVVNSARLRLAVNGSFPEFDQRFGGGLMKQFGERSMLTERRRALINDIGGARRPINFLHAVPSSQGNVRFLKPAHSHSGGRNMHKLRRLERKVIYVRSLRDTVWSFITGIYRWNPFRSYGDQLRFSNR